MKTPRVYISGLHSGPNPSPGVGVARSLRKAFPNSVLIGVDYGRASSGIHWPDFDSVSVQRPWQEAEPGVFRALVAQAVEQGCLWLPGLDLEAKLLASTLPAFIAAGCILSPSARALQLSGKPCDWAAETLGLKRVASLALSAPDDTLYDFCRQHGWRVWAKGPDYEAHAVFSWSDLLCARGILQRTWSNDATVGFVEGHVEGTEESVVFAALRGELLGSAAMVKRTITQEGKTWSGSVAPAATDLLDGLRALVEKLAWTGGGEVEMIRDSTDRLWLMEINPRFPAWVHAATLSGVNLPGSLVAAAMGEADLAQALAAGTGEGSEFARIVVEVPVRTGFPLPHATRRPRRSTMSTKTGPGVEHPSGMPHLSSRIIGSLAGNDASRPSSSAAPPIEIDLDTKRTPHFVMLPSVLKNRMDGAYSLAQSCSTDSLRVRIAYSVKTNPGEEVMRQACESGLWAECISRGEVELALRAGFRPDGLILNGPSKRCGSVDLIEEALGGLRVRAVFCDSLEELAQSIRGIRGGRWRPPEVLGVRLRPPFFASRFGIDVGDPDSFRRLASLLRFLPDGVQLGVHFHLASSRIGLDAWFRLCDSMIEWADAISAGAERSVAALDVGGGFSPGDWDELGPAIDSFAHQLTLRIPTVKLLLMEPGKALVQPAGALVARLLEVRGGARGRTAVADACIADLPDLTSHPHRVWCVSSTGAKWNELPSSGPDALVGRICMEQDILVQSTKLSDDARPGDHIVVEQCGAYDMSMYYDFGRGRTGAR